MISVSARYFWIIRKKPLKVWYAARRRRPPFSFFQVEQLLQATGDTVTWRRLCACLCSRCINEVYVGSEAWVNCERAATRRAEMPLIVTAALSKQQPLWSEAKSHHLQSSPRPHPNHRQPLTPFHWAGRPAVGLTAGWTKARLHRRWDAVGHKPKVFPSGQTSFSFQVYLKSRRATKGTSHSSD